MKKLWLFPLVLLLAAADKECAPRSDLDRASQQLNGAVCAWRDDSNNNKEIVCVGHGKRYVCLVDGDRAECAVTGVSPTEAP